MKNKRDTLLKEIKHRNMDKIAQKIIDNYNESAYMIWSYNRRNNGYYDFKGLIDLRLYFDANTVVNSVTNYICYKAPGMKFNVIVGGY